MLTESRLLEWGAIEVGDQEYEYHKVYYINGIFYDVDRRLKTVDRIYTFKYAKTYRYLLAEITGPYHVRCHQPLYQLSNQLESQLWWCNYCNKELDLNPPPMETMVETIKGINEHSDKYSVFQPLKEEYLQLLQEAKTLSAPNSELNWCECGQRKEPNQRYCRYCDAYFDARLDVELEDIT